MRENEMERIYGPEHLAIQELAESRRLADRLEQIIVAPTISAEHKAFIESRDLFFLSTVDHRGFPSCSYKGGSVGFVQVLDDRTLAFPSYDGNGMYLSLGNVATSGKVGMLFIDFCKPHRVRVHGTATLGRDPELLRRFHGAEWVVQVAIAEIWVNCGRYIHRHQRVEDSRYVPRPGHSPPFPQWKRIDAIQDSLRDHDRRTAEAHGAPLTPEEYQALLEKGQS